jgi:hypothetical protein
VSSANGLQIQQSAVGSLVEPSDASLSMEVSGVQQRSPAMVAGCPCFPRRRAALQTLSHLEGPAVLRGQHFSSLFVPTIRLGGAR